MAESLPDFLRFIGSGVCHQKIELSFFSGQIYLPACSRCTGIYVGFMLSVLAIVLIERKIKANPPTNKQLILVISFFILMGLDVALTTYSIIKPNNYIRFATGFLAGWSLSLVLVPLLNMSIFSKALKNAYLQKRKNLILWSSALILTGAFFIFTYREFAFFWSALTIIGIIIFYTFVILIIIFASIKRLSNRIGSIKIFIPVFFGGTLLSILLIFGIALIRRFFSII